VIDSRAPASRTTTLGELDDMARELTHHGWIVRFELTPPVLGTPRGHLAVTRPLLSKAEYLVAGPARHEIHVWIHTGGDIRPLGTVLDVDEVHDLLRQEIRESSRAEHSRSAGQDAFH
jgi:hypothetical protein